MFDLILKTAQVLSTDDKDKQGKIQVIIECEGEGWDKKLAPWAIPLISNTSESTMEMHHPKEGSQVWVLVDKYYKRFYYISNRYFYNLFDFSKVSGLLDKCDKINKDYKNIDFKYFSDKTLVFHNNSDGSTGLINSQGTMIYIDKDGSLVKTINKDETITVKGDKSETIKGKNTIDISGQTSIKNKGKVSLSSNSSIECNAQSSIKIKSSTPSLIEIGNAVTTLGGILTELCNDLASLTTTGTKNAHTAPILTSQMLALIPKIKMTFK